MSEHVSLPSKECPIRKHPHFVNFIWAFIMDPPLIMFCRTVVGLGRGFRLTACTSDTGLPVVSAKKRIEVSPPDKLKSSDKGGLRRLTRALERKFRGDLFSYTIASITDWTVKEEKNIAASRRSKFKPNG